MPTLRKLNKIYGFLEKQGLDALLISLPANITYLTNYISRDSFLLLSKKRNIYLTDFRYTKEARNHLNKSFSVKQTNGALFSSLSSQCFKLGAQKVGFEEKHLSFFQHERLKEKLDKKIVLVPTKGTVEGLRQLKTPEEMTKITEATRITVSALNFIKNHLSPGKSEIEIAGELQRFIRYNGAAGASFEIIVASGPNSSFPHHISSNRKLRNNEPVLIDIGVDYSGYKSDLTRVFFLGKINFLVRKVYEIVLNAQKKAIGKIKPTVKIGEIDRAARQYIAKKGYGECFGHNLGHGIGLEVHEAPNISSQEENELKPGMVFTVEPGIYLPGKFGIRIEDMVKVNKKGVEVISGSLNK